MSNESRERRTSPAQPIRDDINVIRIAKVDIFYR